MLLAGGQAIAGGQGPPGAPSEEVRALWKRVRAVGPAETLRLMRCAWAGAGAVATPSFSAACRPTRRAAALPAAVGRAIAGSWLLHKLPKPAGMPTPDVHCPWGRPVVDGSCQQRPLLSCCGLAVCSPGPHCRAWLCLRQQQQRLHSLAQWRATGDTGHSCRWRERYVAQAAVALPKPLRLLQPVPRSERQCCERRRLLPPAATCLPPPAAAACCRLPPLHISRLCCAVSTWSRILARV